MSSHETVSYFLPANLFDTESLRVLSRVSANLGIEAWGTCGLFYKGLLNRRFGPPQLPVDKDVSVTSLEEARILDAALRQAAPTVRWAVQATGDGFPVNGLIQPVTMKLGAVRLVDLNGSQAEVRLEGRHTSEHLTEGLVALNGSAVEHATEKEPFLDFAVTTARKLLLYYPGLRLSGRLRQLYEVRHGEHRTVAFVGNISQLKKEVRAKEADMSAASRAVWHGLRENELPVAWEIVRQVRSVDRSPVYVPVVPVCELPDALQQQALAKRDANLQPTAVTRPEALPPPEGYASWMHWMVFNTDDAMFREWFLNQTRSRYPYGGKDTYLSSILDYSRFAGMPGVKNDGFQKVTHGGWQLDQHMISSTLQVETDDLIAGIALRDGDDGYAMKVRAGIRLGMLHHDIGKLINVHTPGAHGAASVKLWKRSAAEWVGEVELRVAAFCMMGHDYFGRLSCGITEKVGMPLDASDFDPNAETSYLGAMCPQRIGNVIAHYGESDWRDAIRILRRVWEADVGSVPALRWMRPEGEMVERILLKRFSDKIAA